MVGSVGSETAARAAGAIEPTAVMDATSRTAANLATERRRLHAAAEGNRVAIPVSHRPHHLVREHRAERSRPRAASRSAVRSEAASGLVEREVMGVARHQLDPFTGIGP